jgi:hypothetical protein
LREAADSRPRWNTVAGGLRNVELDVDVLDSELPSLDDRSQRRLAKRSWIRIRMRLTARTLSSEVLPAFCSPIMVMSISVALHREDS